MLSRKTRTDYQTLLDGKALQQRDDIAITYIATNQQPKEITYNQLRQRALPYGAKLAAQGIVPRDLVVIAHTDILASIYAFWGALALGAIPSIFPTLTDKLDPQTYIQNLNKLIQLSQVKAIITTEEFAQILPNLDCFVVVDSGNLPDESPAIHSATHDSIAFLQHSSGTTGLQKGVALSHAAVLNQLASYSDALSVNKQDVVVSWLPLYHDMGLIAGFLLPLIQGIPLVLMSPFDWIAHPAMLLRAIDTYHGTLCWLPNFAYNHMARRIRKRDREGLSLSSVRAFINCSEPVRHDSHQQFLDTFSDTAISARHLQVSYAMAENTFAVTQTPAGQVATIDTVNRDALEQSHRAIPDDNGITLVSCGDPIANTQIRIVDENNNILPERHVGQVLVQSDCILTEYYHRPDLQPFVDGWYHTGDMGYLADGELYIIGRQKDIIINAGKNIYPQDIEAAVNTVEGVHKGRCVVFGVFDAREGTERIAVVAEREDTNLSDDKALKKRIRQRIAQQTTVAAAYVTIVGDSWLIKTSSGKIARSANCDKWLAEFMSDL